MSGLSHWPTALVDPELDVPPDLCTWNGSLVAQRFGIHRNNMLISLVDALASTFDVTQQLVGDTFFRAMAQLYVRQHPPLSPVLSDYGADFADFVAQFPPAASVAYLSDVARLEFLRMQSLHAADAIPMSVDQAQVWLRDPEQLARLVFTISPGVHAFQSTHAAVSVWAAHQPDSGLRMEEVDVTQPECALVHREDWDVPVLAVDAPTLKLVNLLQKGQRLGDALQRVGSTQPAWNPVQALALLFRHGLVAQMALGVPCPAN